MLELVLDSIQDLLEADELEAVMLLIPRYLMVLEVNAEKQCDKFLQEKK